MNISVAKYEARRRAVFQIQGSDDPRGPPPEQQGSRRHGLAGAGQNYYANPTDQMFMVGSQGQAIGVTHHGATVPGVPGVPGPPQQQTHSFQEAPGRPPQQQAPATSISGAAATARRNRSAGGCNPAPLSRCGGNYWVGGCEGQSRVPPGIFGHWIRVRPPLSCHDQCQYGT
jgi:hypothetical protein